MVAKTYVTMRGLRVGVLVYESLQELDPIRNADAVLEVLRYAYPESMIPKRFGSLKGLTAPILVYESIDEAERVKPGGVLEECNNNLAYRGPLNDVREIICDWLETKSGITRDSKPVLGKDKKPRVDKDGNAVTEYVMFDKDGKEVKYSDGRWADHVCATKGWDDLTQFQSEVDTLFANLKDDKGQLAPLAVDITQKERIFRGPVKIAARYIEAAQKILAGSKVEKFIACVKAEANVELALTGDAAKDLDAFARAMKALLDARERAKLSDPDAIIA